MPGPTTVSRNVPWIRAPSELRLCSDVRLGRSKRVVPRPMSRGFFLSSLDRRVPPVVGDAVCQHAHPRAAASRRTTTACAHAFSAHAWRWRGCRRSPLPSPVWKHHVVWGPRTRLAVAPLSRHSASLAHSAHSAHPAHPTPSAPSAHSPPPLWSAASAL